ncbi:unnamed protein product [Phaeothamnion confervicola]
MRTGADFLPPEALEKAKAGNKFEKTKLAKCGSATFHEVYKWAAAVRSGNFTWEDLDIDDADVRIKYVGAFHRRKRAPGTFMMRCKIPNGIVTADQLRYAAGCAAKYDPRVGVLDITTRQSLQIRGVTLQDMDGVVDGLRRAGVPSLMSGLDNLRNVVGHPLAGIDPEEVADTRALCRALDAWYTANGEGNLEFCNLPRKINVAVSGSADDFSHTMVNDVGLQAAVRGGRVGYDVVVGGYFSIKRYAKSIPLGLWVPEEHALAFCQAVLRIFRDRGDRADRQKTRLMWLVEALCVEDFRGALLAEMARADPAAAAAAGQTFGTVILPGGGGDDATAAAAISSGGQKTGRRELLGVHRQKQAGRSWVGVCVPAGRLSVADAMLAADVAERYAGGEMRLTVDQNILFPNVAEDDVEEMQRMPFFKTHPVRHGDVTSGTVSCTGAQFCGLALAETKMRAVEISAMLDAELAFPNGAPTVHWTGCPNSCGQAQVGDIGLMGGPAKKNGKAVEGYNIFLKTPPANAAADAHGGLGEIWRKGVPAATEDLFPVLRELCVTHFGGVPRNS